MSLAVSSSPHIRDKKSTSGIMLDVVIALIPALLASFTIFGYRALILTLVSVVSCVIFEHLSCLVLKRKSSVGDLSAVVTGILLAFNVPANCPYWVVVIGAGVAIVVVKMFFGGLGQNFVNPALAARIVLMLSFPVEMTIFAVKENFAAVSEATNNADLVTSATPLALNAKGEMSYSYLELFMGQHAGTIGEVCAWAILLGGAYLLVRKIIEIWIPLVYIGSVFVLTELTNLMGVQNADPVLAVLSGGLLLGAIFMATDYATSPITLKGKIIFALGCGIITVLIRIFGAAAEGVSFAIVVMNILVPHINRMTETVPVGDMRNVKK